MSERVGIDIRSYSKQFLTEVILLYQTYPCLWKTKSEEHLDRYARETAWQEMLRKFREVDKDITREGVIKKMNSLRTSWRKEAKKMRQYKYQQLMNADGEEAVPQTYYPKLWYFDILSYIDEHDPLGETAADISEVQTTSESSDLHGDTTSMEILVKTEDFSRNFADSASPQLYSECSQSQPNAKRQKIENPNTPDSAGTSQSELLVTQSLPAEDCYDHFGRYVASMLRTIGSPNAIMLQQDITIMITNRMCALPQRQTM